VASESSERVYGDLVAGLLDARDDLATELFDSELEAAVEHGEISADAATRLRFWQRASLRAFHDHASSVLPTALAALDASRNDAKTSVTSLLDIIRDDVADDSHPVSAPAAPADDPDPDADGAPSPPSTIRLPRTISLEAPRSRLLVADLISVSRTEDH